MRFFPVAPVAVLLVAIASPAAAQVPEPFATTTDPADRAIMAEVASALSSRSPEIARLDAVLAKLPRPTPLRGFVQMGRAYALGRAQDAGPAVAAIEEAMRLLPDDPRPKLVASTIYTFSGSPQRAADLWMQASRESPDVARQSDRYVMSALIGRLADIGDGARGDRLNARMNEIGFSAGLAPERSNAALARTREAVRSQQEGEAIQNVTAIGDPDDLLSLYADRRYAALWPRIADWAGADLATQSRRYLEELRGGWTAADTFETAVPYARQLVKLDAYAAVVGLFLPMFDRLKPSVGQLNDEQTNATFLAPVVARSLVYMGRASEARALLAKVAAALPVDDIAFHLNIEGAYVTIAFRATDWPDVIARADAFLPRARGLGSKINRSAVIGAQSMRACALWRLDRHAEAQPATAEVLLNEATMPDLAMDLHICRGDVAAARRHVIARLADEATRQWALAFVQPERVATSTPIARLMGPLEQAVRTSPDVVTAANRVGRILPQPVNATLPKGFDPFRAPLHTPPPGPGET
jgi:hypothetical protein